MNKKWLMIGGSVCVVLLVVLAFVLKGNSLKKTIKEVEEYREYEMVAHMDILENDELKSYQVTSTYASINDFDYYKIELYDKSLNQSQIIVRNGEGVFVLTPTLNQAFAFQSEWPNNSFKPYFYHSLVSFLKENKKEKVKDGYIVSGDMTYENDPRVKKQEVKFDKALVPVYVSVFDENDTEIVKLIVSSFKSDLKLNEDAFKQDLLMKDAKTKYTSVSSSLPMYPVALMGSTLQNEKTTVIDDVTNHILKFTGSKSYTIIESAMSKSETLEVIHVDSDMIEMLDGITYASKNQLTYINSGIVSSIYSNDLSDQEMLAVLSSMQVSSVK